MVVFINIKETVSNHIAIVSYFNEIGYSVDTVQFVGDSRLNDNWKPYGSWMADLQTPDEAQLLMDKVAGKFSNLEGRVKECRKRMQSI